MTSSSLSESDRFDRPMKRRSFLTWAAIGSFLAAWGVALVGALRLPIPAVYAEASARFRIGRPDRFVIGSATRIASRNVWVFRDEKGLYAISAVCTHLGCIVNRDADQFVCPCHGTFFDAYGKVKSGPAPAPLPWLEIGLHPSGELIVDSESTVPMGNRYEL